MGLENFENVILIGSIQDSYVPFDGARFEVAANVADQKHGDVVVEMA